MAIGSRRATVALVADPRGLDKGLNAARSKFRAFASNIARGIGGAASKVGSLLAQSLNPLGRGIDLLTGQVDDVMEWERGLARLSITQGKSNEEMAAMGEELTQISSQSGIARNEVLKGAAAWQALTGDVEGGIDAARTFAIASQATGTSVTDIATASASLSGNLKVTSKEMERMLSILNSQGKGDGAIELKDLAAELPSLSAQFKDFAGGTGLPGGAELGAAIQTIRKNFGSAEQAGTGFSALMGAIVGNADKLEKAGIKVYDEKGNQRAFSAIIKDMRALNLSEKKKKDLLGSKEARLSLNALEDNWESFQGMVRNTDVKSLGNDFERYLETPAGKLDKAMNGLKLAAASAFKPELIEAFAGAMSSVAEGVAGTIQLLGKLEAEIARLSGDDMLMFSAERQAEFAAQQKIGAAPGEAAGAGPGLVRDTSGEMSLDSGGGFNVGQTAASRARYIASLNGRSGAIGRNTTPYGPAAPVAAPAPGWGEAIQKDILRTLQAIDQSVKRSSVSVSVGDNAVAYAGDNATDRRRKPGG